MRAVPFRRRPARGLLLLATALVLLWRPGAVRAETPALGALLAREGYGSVAIVRPRPEVLAVQAAVNGQPARFILDTGADAVLLRRHWVAHAGIPVEKLPGTLRGVSGSEEGDLARGTLETLRLGNVEIRAVPVFISNLDAFSDPPKGRLRGDGFLGVQFLAACGAVIDLQNLRLYLRAPGRRPAVDLGPGLRRLGMTEIPVARAGLKYLVKATINGFPTRLVLDTGAFRTTLDSRVASRFGPAANARANLRLVDLGGRRAEGRTAGLRSLEIGGFAVPETRVALFDLGLRTEAVAGLLGVNVLGVCGAVIDCGGNRLYLGDRGQGLAWRGRFDAPEPARVSPPFLPTWARVPQPIGSGFRHRQ